MDIKRSDLKLYARRALKGCWGTIIGATLVYMAISYLFLIALESVMLAMLGNGIRTLLGGAVTIQVQTAGVTASVGMLLVILAVLYFVYLVVILLMSVGYQRLYLDAASGQKAKISTLFWAFSHKPWKFILISVLVALLAWITLLPVYVLAIASALTGRGSFAMVFLFVYYVIMIIVYAYVLLTFSQFYLILVEDPEKGIFEALSESHALMKGKRGSYFVLCLSFLGIALLGLLSGGLAMLWISPYMGCTFAVFYLALKGAVPEKLRLSPAQTAAASGPAYPGGGYYREVTPPQQSGYSPASGYPAGGGYQQTQQGGYQAQPGGYQAQQGGQQTQQSGYQARQDAYQMQQGGYQAQQGGYSYQSQQDTYQPQQAPISQEPASQGTKLEEPENRNPENGNPEYETPSENP